MLYLNCQQAQEVRNSLTEEEWTWTACLGISEGNTRHTLEQRKEQYRHAALAAKRGGDMPTAAKYAKIAKVRSSASSCGLLGIGVLILFLVPEDAL